MTLSWVVLASLLASSLVLTGWILLRQGVLRESESAGATLALTEACDLAESIRSDDPQAVRAHLSGLFRNENVLFAALTTAGGEVREQMGEMPVGFAPGPPPDSVRVHRQGRMLLVLAPVLDPSLKVVGTLHLGYSLGETFKGLDRGLLCLLAAGLLLVAGASLWIRVQARRISGPLLDLAHAARHWGDGHAAPVLRAPRHDEVDRVAPAFQEMAQHLQDSRRRAEQQNRQLEEIVRERTEELRRKNQTLAVQNERVLESSRMKSEFLANMSHELRTPLNAILALSELLYDEVTGPLANEEQKRQIDMIQKSGEGLLRLINDVLDLSRIEAGKTDLRRSPTDTASLLREACEEIRQLALKKGLEFRIDLQAGPPLWIDPDRVRQVMHNLLGNAIKFTERGHVTVQSLCDPEKERLTITVEDTGVGIAPQDHESIFLEFHQVDGSATRRHGGTGLGLAISRRLVRLMGGELTLRSDLGHGTTFTCWFPATREKPESETQDQQADAPTEGIGTARILLIDENTESNELLTQGLMQAGFEVRMAQAPDDVLQHLGRYQPDCIILDPLISDGSGIRLLEELERSALRGGIPILIHTCEDLSREEWSAVARRADRILPKGNGVTPVVEEVRRLVDDFRSRTCAGMEADPSREAA